MAEPKVPDMDLPGMWTYSDFEGGDPDERSYAQRERDAIEVTPLPKPEDPIDGAILAHFHMKVDDLVEQVFEGIDDYINRHPEITNEIAQQVLRRRACDMAEGYRTWVEEGE